jgi:hypothetical protein
MSQTGRLPTHDRSQAAFGDPLRSSVTVGHLELGERKAFIWKYYFL